MTSPKSMRFLGVPGVGSAFSYRLVPRTRVKGGGRRQQPRNGRHGTWGGAGSSQPTRRPTLFPRPLDGWGWHARGWKVGSTTPSPRSDYVRVPVGGRRQERRLIPGRVSNPSGASPPRPADHQGLTCVGRSSASSSSPSPSLATMALPMSAPSVRRESR